MSKDSEQEYSYLFYNDFVTQVPFRLFQMAWTSVISPWFFQSAPTEQQEAENDKKQKKLERRLKRQQH